MHSILQLIHVNFSEHCQLVCVQKSPLTLQLDGQSITCSYWRLTAPRYYGFHPISSNGTWYLSFKDTQPTSGKSRVGYLKHLNYQFGAAGFTCSRLGHISTNFFCSDALAGLIALQVQWEPEKHTVRAKQMYERKNMLRLLIKWMIKGKKAVS